MEMSIEEQLALSSSDPRRSSRAKLSPSTRSNSLDTSPQSSPAAKSSQDTSVTRDGTSDSVIDSIPSKRAGLRKRKHASSISNDPIPKAMKALSDEERESWQGWVELESNPELFNYILRQYGVQNVKIREVYGLDDEALSFLPQPVYGLIFLFRYRDEDQELETEDIPRCPGHVWFANQTINNACATIALLNIVMNVPALDIGDALRCFKEETQELRPPYRGQRLGQNKFIRNIHNSFARRMDMLNSDLALENELDKWKKAQKAPNSKRKKSTSAKKKNRVEEQSGYHFIAYVPISGTVWRLDGLQWAPVAVGEYKTNWVSVARDHISAHISQYADDDVNYNLLSLCRSPLCIIPEKLAQNTKSLISIEDALSASNPAWREFMDINELATLKPEPEPNFGMTQEMIDQAVISDSARRQINSPDPFDLIEYCRRLIQEQQRLQLEFVEEAAHIDQEDALAARRKHDHTPAIYNSIKELAGKGVLSKIMRDVQEGNC